MTTKALPALSDILPAAAAAKIGQSVRGAWTRAVARQLVITGEHLNMDPRDLAKSDAVKGMLDQIGERIKDIDDTTRARVGGYIERGRREGMSIEQMRKLIEADPSGAFSATRARLIARTESAVAFNRSSVAGWSASGRVTHVNVRDGDACGWTHHESSDKANGSTRTLAEADAHPTAHPACLRVLMPVVN